jgi:nickel/cobalt transporter (NicO) family protein
MLASSLFTLFLSGLGLGLIHAFDSDHLVAVSNLSVHRPNLKKTLDYSFHWAIGHGFVLLLLGLYASLIGIKIPLLVSHWAELLVGLMLIILGCWTIFQLYKEHNSCLQIIKTNKISNHTPLLVGIVHGTAGSATVLALIPAIQLSSPIITIAYMIFFAIGVLLSMSSFAVLFSHSQQQLAKYNFSIYYFFRVFIGLFAIVLGFIWLI